MAATKAKKGPVRKAVRAVKRAAETVVDKMRKRRATRLKKKAARISARADRVMARASKKSAKRTAKR